MQQTLGNFPDPPSSPDMPPSSPHMPPLIADVRMVGVSDNYWLSIGAMVKYSKTNMRPDKELLAPLAIFHYDDGTLKDMISPDLWEQMDKESYKIFSETAYLCLKDERAERPHIDQIVSRLQMALHLHTKHEDRLKLMEKSQVAAEVEGTSTNHSKVIYVFNVEVILVINDIYPSAKNL